MTREVTRTIVYFVHRYRLGVLEVKFFPVFLFLLSIPRLGIYLVLNQGVCIPKHWDRPDRGQFLASASTPTCRDNSLKVKLLENGH